MPFDVIQSPGNARASQTRFNTVPARTLGSNVQKILTVTFELQFAFGKARALGFG